MWRGSCSTTSGRRRPACAEERRTHPRGGRAAPPSAAPRRAWRGRPQRRPLADCPARRPARLFAAVVTAVTAKYLNSQQPRLVISNVRLARTQRGERLHWRTLITMKDIVAQGVVIASGVA